MALAFAASRMSGQRLFTPATKVCKAASGAPSLPEVKTNPAGTFGSLTMAVTYWTLVLVGDNQTRRGTVLLLLQSFQFFFGRKSTLPPVVQRMVVMSLCDFGHR